MAALIANPGSTAASLDEFIDALASSPDGENYITVSSTWAGSTINDPTINGSTLILGGDLYRSSQRLDGFDLLDIEHPIEHVSIANLPSNAAYGGGFLDAPCSIDPMIQPFDLDPIRSCQRMQFQDEDRIVFTVNSRFEITIYFAPHLPFPGGSGSPNLTDLTATKAAVKSVRFRLDR